MIPETSVDDIRYLECPHCHAEVMVRPDGACLACGKSLDRLEGSRPEITMVTIENIDQLPACCFLCGDYTIRVQTLSWTFRVEPIGLSPWAAPLVLLFSYLPGSEYRTSQRVNLPVCPKCRKPAKRVKPLSVMTGLECRLEVHRNFRDQFEKLNGKHKLEWEGDIRLDNKPPPSASLVPTIKI